MQHPDEGTIHAWLDGALPPVEARALEEHLAGCAACGAAVAEARGLLAASSRILSALDSVPGGVLPATEPEASGIAGVKARRVHAPRWRTTPWRAAAAIVVIGSVGWLASRSGGNQRTATEVAATYDTALQGTTGAVNGTLRGVPERATGTAMAESSPAARVVSPKVAPRAAPQAAPQAQAGYVATRPAAPSANSTSTASRLEASPPPRAAAKMAVGGATGEGAGMGSAFGTGAGEFARAPNVIADQSRRAVRPAGSAAAADLASQADARALQQRSIASPPAVVTQSESAMKTMAGRVARLMPGEDALRQLAGCYALEPVASTPAGERDEMLVSQLPRRIELVAERAPTPSAANEMLVRPAAGEPPFAAGMRGVWETTARDSMQIRIGDAMRMTLTVVGDSIRGTTASRFGDEGRREVRGKKIRCVER